MKQRKDLDSIKNFMKNKKTIIITIFFFLLTVLVVTNNISWYDNLITQRLVRNNFLVNIFKIITSFGDWFILLPIVILSFFLLKDKKKSIFIAGNLLFSFCTCFILKIIIQRPRPDNMLVTENSFSYPSGHTFVSIAFYGFLLYLINKSNISKNKKYIFNIVLIMLLFLIAISRVYLNAHFASDVLGGIFGGLIYLFIYIKIIKNIEGDINEKKKK